MWQEYYEKQLYPLQDKALAVIEGIPSMFYLTGGTAISRAYFNHRYSDDLDFFVNHVTDFEQKTQVIFEILKANFTKVEISLSYDTFARCFVVENDVRLKIEFVNDVLYRVGEVQKTNIFSRTDTIDNILSNKICALSRNAPKDVADIWQIALHCHFNWKNAITDAQNKDMWVDESQVLIALEKFDVQTLSEVNWIHPFDLGKAQKDMEVILKDVLWGEDNYLCKN